MILSPSLVSSFALPSLLALAASVTSEDAELLPAQPEGWNFERLAMPLDFAPDLGFAGFEELYFAPGMFTADAPDYFSYVAAFELEGDVTFDTNSVDDFLTSYYRGLCVSVSQGRGVELDPEVIQVEVEDAGERFLATVEMVDSFVTGEPLTLHFELDVHARPRHTELFGMASPAARDASIWEALRELRAQWTAARPAPAFLNHIYVVPDAETFAAISSSEFMRTAFAVFEERTTVRPDLSYTGVYFYGERTYFEFLPPGQSPEISAGNSGVAFGLERAGATEGLPARFKTKDIQTFAGPLTRELDGEALPWFTICGIQGVPAATNLSLFTMEYDPEFLARWHGTLAPKTAGIRRDQVLARYAAKLGGTDRPFVDITTVTLELEAAQIVRMKEVSEVFGYVIEEHEDRVSLLGPQFSMHCREVEKARGVVAFDMTLSKPLEREPLQLGKAKLTFEGRSARFELGER